MKVIVNEINIYRKEIEDLITEFPRNVIVYGFFISLIFFDTSCATLKIVCDGIISGFIFYLIIEIFPSANKKINKLRHLGQETIRLDLIFEELLTSLKEELRQTGYIVPDEDRFYNVLQNLNVGYMPQSSKLKIISSVISTPHGLQFNYCNLGQILKSHLNLIRKRIIYYNKIADIHGINDLDVEIAELVRNLNEKHINASNTIVQLSYIRNNAALFGTELDLIRDEVKEIQKKLKEKWFTETFLR